MSTITKERLEWLSNISCRDDIDDIDGVEIRELARIALASLEAEPVAWDYEWASCITCDGPQNFERIIEHEAPPEWAIKSGQARSLIPLYTAPPAPVENTGLQRKAALHDALCEKYNVESLTDFVDWQRNHIAELEAAPPAPVGEGETAVMPDYPGCLMTQRECYQAGKNAGLVGAGNSPVIPDDVRRMDWLVSKTVDVREPMVYGSHSIFWSQTITDEDDDYHETKLREQIDAAMAAEQAAAPQQEVKP